MTRTEYVEMVSYIEDRWGPAFWTGAARLYGDFKPLVTDKVYAVLLARASGDPQTARFAPKPAELVALTYAQMRIPDPLPPAINAGDMGWALYSQKHYGKVISLGEAMRRQHQDMVTQEVIFGDIGIPIAGPKYAPAISNETRATLEADGATSS